MQIIQIETTKMKIWNSVSNTIKGASDLFKFGNVDAKIVLISLLDNKQIVYLIYKEK